MDNLIKICQQTKFVTVNLHKDIVARYMFFFFFFWKSGLSFLNPCTTWFSPVLMGIIFFCFFFYPDAALVFLWMLRITFFEEGFFCSLLKICFLLFWESPITSLFCWPLPKITKSPAKTWHDKRYSFSPIAELSFILQMHCIVYIFRLWKKINKTTKKQLDWRIKMHGMCLDWDKNLLRSI